MSNDISMSLMTKRRVDAEKMAARANELIKELEQEEKFGYDIDLFDTDDGRWSGIGIGDLTDHNDSASLAYKIIEGVVATYPDIKMHYYETWNGPLSYEAVSKDGKLEEVKPWMVVVHLQNEENYQRVLAYLQNNPELELELYPERHSLGWEFDGQTEDDLTTERLKDLGQHFPQMPLQVYKYDVCFESANDEVQYETSIYGGQVYWRQCDCVLLALMRWRRHLDVTYEEIIFNTEQVYQTALAKARADEGWWYKKAAAEYLFYKGFLRSLRAEDFAWLKPLADDEYVPACCVLLRGMEENYDEWEERFVNEDTGEEVAITRARRIDGTLFEPDETLKKQLTQTIYALAEGHRFDPEEMSIACFYLPDATSLRLMLIEGGKDDEAQYIEDPAILQELCDKGNKWAAWELYLKYYEGDEEHGIFIDRKRAREFYDLALERGYKLDEDGWNSWDDSDDPGEEDPSSLRRPTTGNRC